MGKSAPAAPDYRGAAEAEAAANQALTTQQTWANRPDQFTPWGSSTWGATQGVDPATGDPITQWQQTQQLTPELQAALNAQIGLQQQKSEFGAGMMGRVRDEYGQPMDWGQFGEMQQLGGFDPLQQRQLQTGYETGELQRGFDFAGPRDEYLSRGLRTSLSDPQETVGRMEQSIYERETSRLDPQFERAEEQLEIKLRNQGLRPGDQAWEAEMQDFNFRRTDAYDRAQQQAITGGQQAGESMFGMERGRLQDINQYLQTMNQNLAGQAGFFNQAQAARTQNAAMQAQMANQAQMEANRQAAQQAQFGNVAQQQMFGQGLQAGQFNQAQQLQRANYANMLRQQAIQEEATKRGLSLNEMNAIMYGQQVQSPQFAAFSQAGRSQGPAYGQAATQQGNFEQQAYQNQMAGMGSLLGLGGSILGGMATGGTGFFG